MNLPAMALPQTNGTRRALAVPSPRVIARGLSRSVQLFGLPSFTAERSMVRNSGVS